MTTLVMSAILLFGGMSYRILPVSDLPPWIFLPFRSAPACPGRAPRRWRRPVATPLEREFSTIAGLDSMTSSNSQGNTQVTLQFTLDRDIDAAAQDVQSAISKSSRSLPADMPTPPSFRKVNPADSAGLFLVLVLRFFAI